MAQHNDQEPHGEVYGGSHKPHKKHHAHAAHAEHEHEEGWIVSFADNVLLMMGFFVILLAMNMGPKGSSAGEPGETSEDRLLDVAIAVREAFHNPVSMTSMVPEDQPLVKRIKNRQTKGDAKPTGSEPTTPSAAVRSTDWAGDGGFVQFAEKEALLDVDAKEAIAEMAKRIAGTRWMIEVRGHASKWETWRDTKKARDLAYQRAWVVGNELVANRVAWDQIRLVSSGDSAPVIAKARTASEAQTNQRTEILILNELTPADPYANAPVPPKKDD